MRRIAPALTTLRSAAIGWPGRSSTLLSAPELTVNPASAGGHALLGPNGSGKTLLASAIASAEPAEWLRGGTLERREGWSPQSVSHVSFESHEALLDNGGTVYRALGVPPGTTPSQAAKFLIVRFGLYRLLYRPVTAISTGEIRKVLLARSLATRPSLLVLDNAFDGLDVPSRHALTELLSTTLKGFRQLLVQGVDASATAHTQVLLLTHRAEEIVNEISTISCCVPPGGEEQDEAGGKDHGGDGLVPGRVITCSREGRSTAEIMQYAGEQKLVLIGAALCRRPELLVLDEPMQGLDLHARRLVLALVERICAANAHRMSLVYITHHYEEVLPCVTHAMHLQGGVATFCGERRAYEASGLVGSAGGGGSAAR